MANKSTKWFFMQGDSRQGPVSSSELRKLAGQGRISADTLVWKAGLADWIEARRLKGLFPVSSGELEPPPPPRARFTPMPQRGIRDQRLSAESNPIGQASPRRSSDESLGLIAALLPLFGAFVMYNWIGQMNLLQNPMASLNMTGCVTVAAVSMLIGVEASRLGIGSSEDLDSRGNRRRNGPVSWALFTLVVFVLGFPAYMAVRARYGLRNYLVLAVLSTVVFGGCWLVLGQAIDQRSQEVRNDLSRLQRQFAR
jgi:hypothetical protein